MSKIIIANYKMNLRLEDYKNILNKVNKKEFKDTNLVLCPPFVYVPYFAKVKKFFKLGCQDISAYKNGKYTGQVSADMLRDFGVEYVLIGHSERRGFETNEEINLKVKSALERGIVPIICVGEQVKNEAVNIVLNQVKSALKGIKEGNIIIAYEPVWSISPGELPTVNYIDKKINSIRNCLQKLGFDCPVLYGGSVDDTNIAELSKSNTDGFLCGGISLKADKFVSLLRGINE